MMNNKKPCAPAFLSTNKLPSMCVLNFFGSADLTNGPRNEEKERQLNQDLTKSARRFAGMHKESAHWAFVYLTSLLFKSQNNIPKTAP